MTGLDVYTIVKDALTVENFTKWLNGLDKDRDIGEANSCDECPIATYMNTIVQANDIPMDLFALVGSLTVAIVGEDCKVIENVIMPSWTTKFVDYVDKETGNFTVSECLVIIERIS